MLSRISNLGGGKFGVENAISNLGGGKFGAENAISNLQFGWVEDLVENAVSNLEFGGWKIWGGKCYLESRIWGVENLGCQMLSRISNLGGGKFRVENAISKFLIWGGVENLEWEMLSRISNLGG